MTLGEQSGVHLDAQRTRAVLRREVDAALVLPTLPTPAPPSGAEQVALGEVTVDVRTEALRLTQLFNLTGHPAMTIPCEPTADGLPCGVQLVGAYGHTLELVELGDGPGSADQGLEGR